MQTHYVTISLVGLCVIYLMLGLLLGAIVGFIFGYRAGSNL